MGTTLALDCISLLVFPCTSQLAECRDHADNDGKAGERSKATFLPQPCALAKLAVKYASRLQIFCIIVGRILFWPSLDEKPSRPPHF